MNKQIIHQDEDGTPYCTGKLTKKQISDSADEDGFYPLSVIENNYALNLTNGDKRSAMKKCVVCNGTDFNIGYGDWFLIIRCKTCEWEIGVRTD